MKLFVAQSFPYVIIKQNCKCPYRICDFPFMTRQQVNHEIEKWEISNMRNYKKKHLIAADVLINNLKKTTKSKYSS